MSGRPERLSAADASNVVMDARDQVNVVLLAGILGVGGFVGERGEADLGLLREAVADRLADPAYPDLARFSQRVSFEGRAPTWQDCRPDLTHHVRQVDPVAGRDGLAHLAGRLMTVPLPPDRPLWELLIVPGAAPEAPGIVLRVHHCVADGVKGVRLVERLFDGVPDASPAPSPAAPGNAPGPSPRRSSWHTLAAAVVRVTAVVRAGVPPTVLLGPLGTERAVAFADVALAPLADAARAAGATVNDLLLAAVGVATEAALRADGRPVPAVLPASVPVALPGRGASGNAVGVMLVPLATGERSRATRLARIAAITRAGKAGARAQGTFELTRSRWGSRVFAWLARRQRFIALFVTNVRGPTERLWVAGAPLERAWPVAPIQGNVRLGVAALSYAGRLGVAVHADVAGVRASVAARALSDELVCFAATEGLPPVAA